ncbi:PfkB family carbohydrate kinase [Dongshaea marina]|uniref:PfkB family carbohydrate kinase n=1 Tax=Dongshaea marina TaxID=2047966 RepID=UPI000D3E4DB7|nr:PfkB family carbohydrate kinase [Dongshaea marina]
MANILLLANLNCDHVLSLNHELHSGGRITYRDQGRRLGGGAANTGTGLLWAGHRVQVAARVGSDETGQWLLEQTRGVGLDTEYVECFTGETGELLILLDVSGERTILRQQRRPDLPHRLPEQGVDYLYVNWQGNELKEYMQKMQSCCRVIAQYPSGTAELRPAHILIASHCDLDLSDDPWQQARSIGGDKLEWLVITYGERGAEAINAEQKIRVDARPVSVVDTTGAGDAFAGGLIHALAQKLEMKQSLAMATEWAAFAVSSSSSTPSHELKAWLRNYPGKSEQPTEPK